MTCASNTNIHAQELKQHAPPPPADASSPLYLEQRQRAADRPRARPPSLLRAILRAFGRSYFPLAALKLLNDVLLLTMPLLLKLLVEHIDSSPAPDGGPHHPFDGTGGASSGSGVFAGGAARSPAAAAGGGGGFLPAWWGDLVAGPNAGYFYAGLLGLAAAVKAFLGAHYEYRMNVVSNRYVDVI